MVNFLVEKRNCPRPSFDTRHFSKIIKELNWRYLTYQKKKLNLRDLPLVREPFTWRHGMNSHSTLRLKPFPSVEWLGGSCSSIVQSILPKLISYHPPIVLDRGGIRKHKTPFRFEIRWLKLEAFKDLVRSWWLGYNMNGSYNHMLATNLRTLSNT